MPLGTTAPGPPRPSVRWVRVPRTGRGRARGAPRTSPSSTPYRATFRARIAARPGNGCSRCVRKHRRHARPSRPPALVSARTSRRCYARTGSRTPSARPRRPKTDAKGGCSLGHPFDPVTIPHDIENRRVATRIDQERNPQVSGAFQRSPQVTGSARLNLSRWRHEFEPRWDYQVRDYVGALSPSPGDTPGDRSPAEAAIHPHRGVALKLVDDFLAFAACSAMVWTARSRISCSRRAIAEMASPRVCRQMGEAPQRAAAAGLPRTRLSGGGPATILWRLVAQRNQRIDRPPFDLVTPSPNPAGTVGTTVRRQYATHRGRP